MQPVAPSPPRLLLDVVSILYEADRVCNDVDAASLVRVGVSFQSSTRQTEFATPATSRRPSAGGSCFNPLRGRQSLQLPLSGSGSRYGVLRLFSHTRGVCINTKGRSSPQDEVLPLPRQCARDRRSKGNIQATQTRSHTSQNRRWTPEVYTGWPSRSLEVNRQAHTVRGLSPHPAEEG